MIVLFFVYLAEVCISINLLCVWWSETAYYAGNEQFENRGFRNGEMESSVIRMRLQYIST